MNENVPIDNNCIDNDVVKFYSGCTSDDDIENDYTSCSNCYTRDAQSTNIYNSVQLNSPNAPNAALNKEVQALNPTPNAALNKEAQALNPTPNATLNKEAQALNPNPNATLNKEAQALNPTPNATLKKEAQALNPTTQHTPTHSLISIKQE